jgi:hypothetical protein
MQSQPCGDDFALMVDQWLAGKKKAHRKSLWLMSCRWQTRTSQQKIRIPEAYTRC